ncbi:MAG: hypothetical protein K2X37_05910 [Chitinophagaceae bacterium]|nr:hypothetical protein [Chitinophagaceae bacterium]
MKIKLLTIFIFIIKISFSQELSVAFFAGTGKSYIIEGVSRRTNARYGVPVSLTGLVAFTPKESNWSVSLSTQQISTSVSGSDIITNQILNGDVYSTSIFLLLQYEKKISDKNSFGYNFGIGVTKETIRPQRTIASADIQNSYSSIATSCFWAHKLSSQFDIITSPSLLNHDPAKSLNYLINGKGNCV